MKRFDMRSTGSAIWHLVSDRPAESRTVHAMRLVATLLSLRVSADSMRAQAGPAEGKRAFKAPGPDRAEH